MYYKCPRRRPLASPMPVVVVIVGVVVVVVVVAVVVVVIVLAWCGVVWYGAVCCSAVW